MALSKLPVRFRSASSPRWLRQLEKVRARKSGSAPSFPALAGGSGVVFAVEPALGDLDRAGDRLAIDLERVLPGAVVGAVDDVARE
jgi:hypothetical protein